MNLNLFYTGYDSSHCGSCWEPSDEELTVLITDLTLDKIKEEFVNYTWEELTFEENYSSEKFLKWLKDKSYDHDNNKQIFFSLYFEMEGRTYPPDFEGSFTDLTEWDIDSCLKPEEVLGKKDWKWIQNSMAEQKQKRIENEKKRKEKKEAEEAKKADYREKLSEYNEFQKLKKKWDGKGKPKDPTYKTPAQKEKEAQKQIEATLKLNEKLKELGVSPLKKGGKNA